MISTDDTRVTPAPAEGLFQERIGGRRIRGERRLRKIELFGRHYAEKSFDPSSVDFDVVVEKQDRLVAQEQIRPELHEASNGGCFGSGLNNGDVGFRMDVSLVVVVEENVIAARLFEVGCVKPFAALNEDKDVAIRMGRFAFDAQLAIGIEAVLARPQFLPIERRPHLAFAERAVEDSEGCFFKRARFHASRDVADEFNIDIRPRTPAGVQSALEKVQERMGMALRPIRDFATRTSHGRIRRKGRGRRVRGGQGRLRASLGSRLARCSHGRENSSGSKKAFGR